MSQPFRGYSQVSSIYYIQPVKILGSQYSMIRICVVSLVSQSCSLAFWFSLHMIHIIMWRPVPSPLGKVFCPMARV